MWSKMVEKAVLNAKRAFVDVRTQNHQTCEEDRKTRSPLIGNSSTQAHPRRGRRTLPQGGSWESADGLLEICVKED
jgi:hypothetical protein